jgi:hypothetical protein
MRFVLTVRGVNMIDLEILLPIHTETTGTPPAIEASGGGQMERAEHYGDPATISGFGFRTTT